MIVWAIIFLSHLSGDEEWYVNHEYYGLFLSHLSGDEVANGIFPNPDTFLSHLSGDEVRLLMLLMT